MLAGHVRSFEFSAVILCLPVFSPSDSMPVASSLSSLDTANHCESLGAFSRVIMVNRLIAKPYDMATKNVVSLKPLSLDSCSLPPRNSRANLGNNPHEYQFLICFTGDYEMVLKELLERLNEVNVQAFIVVLGTEQSVRLALTVLYLLSFQIMNI